LTSLTRQPQSPHYDYTPSEGFMFVFIILWVRAEPSWMSFPLPTRRFSKSRLLFYYWAKMSQK
ncbi:hypothetical protein, partial [Streptococcus parasuis]